MKGHKEQGAALFIALIILLLVSMMGVSAMKGGLFHERMAFNSQAEEMTFQAAETAIGGVIQEARRPTSTLLSELSSTRAVKSHCITRKAGLVADACAASATLDTRATVQAESQSQFDRTRPLMGTDAASLVDNQFHTIGEGKFVASANMPFGNRNRQEWSKKGPGDSQFSLPDPDVLKPPGQPVE
jgi:type IV pilus assembly protein PilX